MPSLKAIRSRIRSVQNTQKITRAMKLIAATRLRRAQDAILAARPYARGLADVIAEVAARAGADAHPLLERRPLRRVKLIVLTGDRGLAGAFNANVLRTTERYVIDHPPAAPGGHEALGMIVVGRKGRDYLKRRKYPVERELGAPGSAEALARAAEITHAVVGLYRERQIDGVFVIYNEFKSAVTQRVEVEQLLPVVPKKLPEGAAGDYLYEPSQQAVLDHILPLYVEIEIYRTLLESIASQFGAQMTAMDNATRNATEMVGRLTLQYNRARQAAITKELLEIIGGAEALKG
jgi:F-type H+-transporting ATPase subunit gamma